MSFAENGRGELIRIRLHKQEIRLAQLAGLTITAGGIRLFQKPAVFYQTESLSVAQHIMSLSMSDYDLDSVIEQKDREFHRKPIYVVNLSGKDIDRYLSETGALTCGDDGMHILSDIPKEVFSSDEAKRAFLRGCFLGGGTCVDPKRSYHLELICRTESVAHTIFSLIQEYRITARIFTRKERFVVYLKEADEVMGFLALIGADSAAIGFANVRVEKDMRNYINRKNNCETANIDKQIVASLKQQAAIRKILANMPEDALPDSLREAAELRMNYPDATLTDLAELAGIQKSGMNHRLARLIRMAEELKE